MTALWNASDKSSNVSLDGTFLIATCSTASTVGVRGDTGHATSKWYFEATVTGQTTNGSAWSIGIANATETLTNASANNYVGQTNNSVGCLSSSQQVRQNGAQLTGTTGTNIIVFVGQIQQFCIDLDNKRFWTKKTSDANWNNNGSADPNGNVGGADISALTGTIYPAFTSNQTGDQVTANFGATAFTGTKPSQFSAWGLTSETITVDKWFQDLRSNRNPNLEVIGY